MTKLVFSSLLFAATCFSQGYTQLTNTALTSVCPANGYGWNGGAGPMPENYAWADNCENIVDDWGGALVDTRRNRMCIWGGGHSSYPGNEWYCLELDTLSTTYIARTNSSAPTMVRLNQPSVYEVDCSPNPDGTPLSTHSYQGLVYFPKADKYAKLLGANFCGNQLDTALYLFDPDTLTWSKPTLTGDTGYSAQWASCVLDPNSVQESMLCFVGNNDFYRFNIETNVVTELVPFNDNIIRTASTLVLDPMRQVLWAFGTSFDGDPDNGAAYSIDLTDPSYPVVDQTSAVAGCNNLIKFPYPSIQWDAAIQRVVYYVPVAVGSTTADNRIGIFDPVTLSCVEQPITGGPSASAPIRASFHGMFDRFAYVPGLGKYALCNDPTADCYTFTLNLTATHGLGSSTYTCIDKDGDGYGIGSGCSGADADDQDDEVIDATDALAKWTNMAGYLAHLGYTPGTIRYLSPTGVDTGACTSAASPCATWAYIAASVMACDATILRSGNYDYSMDPPSGTSGCPTLVMNYPGETAAFNNPNASGISGLNKIFLVVDGVKLNGNQPGGGGITSFGSFPYDLDTCHNNIIRNVESTGQKWGLVLDTCADVKIENYVGHTSAEFGEHGIYATNHDGYVDMMSDVSDRCMNNFTLSRSLLYLNLYNGIQLNGRFCNAYLGQSIAYGNDICAYSLLTGVRDSRLQSLVAFGNTTCGITQFAYQDWCTAYDSGPCPYPMTGNVIEHFSFYGTGVDQADVPSVSGQRAFIANSTATTTPGMENTIRNVAVMVPGTGTGTSQYPCLVYATTTLESSADASTFQGVVCQQIDVGDGAGTGVLGYGPGPSFGYDPKTCAEMIALSVNSENCTNDDPLFTAASPSYWDTLSMFNLRLAEGSPALNAGSVSTTVYDVMGTPFAVSAPSMGAYETNSNPALTGSTLSGTITFSGAVTIH